jgi:hypothetical protein
MVICFYKQKQMKGKNKMTKFDTLIKFKDGSHMYTRNHKIAFENAISNGLNDPENWMYMYSQNNKDFFKNIAMRNYINFEFKTKEVA